MHPHCCLCSKRMRKIFRIGRRQVRKDLEVTRILRVLHECPGDKVGDSHPPKRQNRNSSRASRFDEDNSFQSQTRVPLALSSASTTPWALSPSKLVRVPSSGRSETPKLVNVPLSRNINVLPRDPSDQTSPLTLRELTKQREWPSQRQLSRRD